MDNQQGPTKQSAGGPQALVEELALCRFGYKKGHNMRRTTERTLSEHRTSRALVIPTRANRELQAVSDADKRFRMVRSKQTES